jgi:hypothetical protein
MEPSYEIKQEFKYYRKAVTALYNKHYIRYFIYNKLEKYYARKHEKKIMSS